MPAGATAHHRKRKKAHTRHVRHRTLTHECTGAGMHRASCPAAPAARKSRLGRIPLPPTHWAQVLHMTVKCRRDATIKSEMSDSCLRGCCTARITCWTTAPQQSATPRCCIHVQGSSTKKHIPLHQQGSAWRQPPTNSRQRAASQPQLRHAALRHNRHSRACPDHHQPLASPCHDTCAFSQAAATASYTQHGSRVLAVCCC